MCVCIHIYIYSYTNFERLISRQRAFASRKGSSQSARQYLPRLLFFTLRRQHTYNSLHIHNTHVDFERQEVCLAWVFVCFSWRVQELAKTCCNGIRFPFAFFCPGSQPSLFNQTPVSCPRARTWQKYLPLVTQGSRTNSPSPKLQRGFTCTVNRKRLRDLKLLKNLYYHSAPQHSLELNVTACTSQKYLATETFNSTPCCEARRQYRCLRSFDWLID